MTEPNGERRRSSFSGGPLDFRSWRPADVVILATLIFNLGVTVTKVSALEEWRAAHSSWVEVTKAETDRRFEIIRDAVQDLRERVVRLEAELEQAAIQGPPKGAIPKRR
jgi:hypothetical protein